MSNICMLHCRYTACVHLFNPFFFCLHNWFHLFSRTMVQFNIYPCNSDRKEGSGNDHQPENFAQRPAVCVVVHFNWVQLYFSGRVHFNQHFNNWRARSHKGKCSSHKSQVSQPTLHNPSLVLIEALFGADSVRLADSKRLACLFKAASADNGDCFWNLRHESLM